MDDIPFVDIEVDKEKYEDGLRAVFKQIHPAWKCEDIKFKVGIITGIAFFADIIRKPHE